MLHAPTSAHQQHMTLPNAREHRRPASIAVSSPRHLHHPIVIPTNPVMHYHAPVSASYATVPVHHVLTAQPLSPNWTSRPAPMQYSMHAHPAHIAHHRRKSAGDHPQPMLIASDRMPFPVDRTPLPGQQQLARSPVVPGFVTFAPQQLNGHRMQFVPSPSTIITAPHARPHAPDKAHSHEVHAQHRVRRQSLPASTKPPVIKRTRFADEVEVYWLDVDERKRLNGSREGTAKLRKGRHDAASGA